MKTKIFISIALVSALAVAFVRAENKTKKKIIFTKEAPQPIGPYSQGVLIGNTLYIAGQVGLDPINGTLDSTGIEGETRRALSNLGAILLAADMDFSHVVKTTIYLKNVKDFSKVNEIYGKNFTKDAPARETVGVADLPKGANIEISMVAVK